METTKKDKVRWIFIVIATGVTGLVIAFLLLYGALIVLLSTMNNGRYEEYGGGIVYYLDTGLLSGKNAAAITYTYDPSDGGDVIEIPDYYKGYPVVKLGGFFGSRGAPNPFRIDIKGLDLKSYHNIKGYSAGTDDEESDGNTVYYDLVLKIGPNIRSIYADQDGLYDGQKTHIVRVYVECDPDNQKFYSENGILYYKTGDKAGEEVEGFCYRGRNY